MSIIFTQKRGVSLGIDVGSTTAKLALLRDGVMTYETYRRHFSRVRETVLEMLADAVSSGHISEDETLHAAVSGSGGMGLASGAGIAFVQEVWATGEVVRGCEPDTSAVIELGGEDAKIIFFEGGAVDERMNGSCAGGTGAFIDQMASLMDVTPDELDELSLKHKKIYPIASRCGVFAKSDVQPLLNQGAAKEDVAASIYQAVVNQTVAGLAQGRRIRRRVMFLGGPLYFNRGLRERFTETLRLCTDPEYISSEDAGDGEKYAGAALFPEWARNSVSAGAAIYALSDSSRYTAAELIEKIKNAVIPSTSTRMDPLFSTEAEYGEFSERHARAGVKFTPISSYTGKAYLGIDCGSTTTKLTLITDEDDAGILYTYYDSNKGDPIEIVRRELEKIYDRCGDRIKIAYSAVTGYGEELIMNAFSVDCGVVETIAHYTAAKFFLPEVDFILDIGGQDIKCFKIKNGAIDRIMLNEACSSGCGSFIETFARAMNMEAEEFSKMGLFAPSPVNLGSRCTVFMNSHIKQAQKDGASPEDISAGLSVSVVKNAIYKVIRAHSPDELGEHIVVQGGTFKNDAVLRAFEREIGRNVTRPTIAGLMGAYGAALYAREMAHKAAKALSDSDSGADADVSSSLISPAELVSFRHTSTTAVCSGCTNRCVLTVNRFPSSHGEKKFISGNKCERGAGVKTGDSLPDMYEFKRKYLTTLPDTRLSTEAKRDSASGNAKKRIGLPLALGMYELLPLWSGVFSALGFDVVVSAPSSRETYEKGQFTIPSDTACYPAKIMHGHIEELCEAGCGVVFYPRMTWNIDEGQSDNHYNCPVVAYYSELLRGNMDVLRENGRVFLYPYLTLGDDKRLAKELYSALREHFPEIKRRDTECAVKNGMARQRAYYDAIKREGERSIKEARAAGKKIMVLAGRPYHVDPEICHGIDKLALSLGFAVITEDAAADYAILPELKVLNQWTYHSRLYRAAEFAAENEDVQLVQLVSFGCGVDAITTDEVRRILETRGKYYTQLKIDEIANLGAVKIRLRSLSAVL